jgi:hypothetical protein
MKDKRRHPRFALNCNIWVESQKLIQGYVEDISKSGVKIKLIDTIKDVDFYKKEISNTHALEFTIDDYIKIEQNSRLIRIETSNDSIKLCYEFTTPTNILDYIFE